eukprot:jgi/Chlat1/270/Chrsp1S03156
MAAVAATALAAPVVCLRLAVTASPEACLRGRRAPAACALRHSLPLRHHHRRRRCAPLAGAPVVVAPSSTRRKAMAAASAEAAMAQDVDKAATAKQTTADDLLIVGPGVLGTMIAKLWLAGFPHARVIGQTNTENSHERLRALGVIPRMKTAAEGSERFPYVVFCAPPSGSTDYVGEVRSAASLFDGQGSLLFTSSSAVYAADDGELCDEVSGKVVEKGASDRVDRLLNCEEVVLQAGGTVHTAERGAHTYFLKAGQVPGRPDSFLNLIHYEDAASLCVAALRAKSRSTTYMGCDNHYLTRQEMMDAVVASGKWKGEFKGFTGTTGGRGRRMNNDVTRQALQWAPKYNSFVEFIEQWQP